MFDDFLRDYSKVSHAYQNIVLAGDFNHGFNGDGYEAECLRELVFSQSIYIVDSEPTFHLSISDSWLDLFIIDSPDKLSSYVKSDAPFIARHDLIELTYAFVTRSVSNRVIRRRTSRDFAVFEFCEFLMHGISGDRAAACIVRCDVSAGNARTAVDSELELLAGVFISSLDQHAPLAQFTDTVLDFDTVLHLNLLNKIKMLGFADSLLDWLFSHLTGRTQVAVDGVGSCSLRLSSSEVPQGSVWGPLLFTLYINDLRSVLTHLQHIIFADDTQIYLSCSPSHLWHPLVLITEDVTALSKFASANGPQLNLGSDPYTHCIDFSSLPSISVNKVVITYVNEARNLGVIFTSILSWKKHLLHISQKSNFALQN